MSVNALMAGKGNIVKMVNIAIKINSSLCGVIPIFSPVV